MDDVTRALIAVGAAVVVNCRPCIQYHLAGARGADATSEDIALALEVGMQVADGAHRKTREYVSELVSTPDGGPSTDESCTTDDGSAPTCSLDTAR